MITKQKAFNKSLVDEDTQIIFMDEAYAKLLDPDDWKVRSLSLTSSVVLASGYNVSLYVFSFCFLKVLTQGGLTAHDRKYKSSTPMTVRCPMFITCQKEMDFGEDHNSAMNVRLRKFYFKTLKSPPVAGVMQYLKENAMDCIAWASSAAVTPADELPPPGPETVFDNSPFDDAERERIRNLQLDESESDVGTDVDETVDLESGEETGGAASEDDECASGWEKTLEDIAQLRDQQPVNSLKQRQLGLIAAGVKRAVHDREIEAEQARERVLEETRERWLSLGMLREEHAHLLTSIEGPYHPEIEQSRNEYFARKREEEQRTLEVKARKYYEDEWILAKEKELQDLQKREDAATDVDVKRALEYMINLTSDALKSKFQHDEVPGLSKLVLLERKKKAVEMNWLSPRKAERVNSIWCPLPYPSHDVEDDWYEQQLFITPSTTNSGSQLSQTPRKSSKRRSRKRGESASQVPKRARITHFFGPSQN